MDLLKSFRGLKRAAEEIVPLKALATRTDLDEVLAESERSPVLVFKHSSACGLSAIAHREIDRLTRDGDPSIYRVVVQDARELSGHIESAFGIRHESPQAILLCDRAPVFHASHRGVTAEAVREAARQAACG